MSTSLIEAARREIARNRDLLTRYQQRPDSLHVRVALERDINAAEDAITAGNFEQLAINLSTLEKHKWMR